MAATFLATPSIPQVSMAVVWLFGRMKKAGIEKPAADTTRPAEARRHDLQDLDAADPDRSVRRLHHDPLLNRYEAAIQAAFRQVADTVVRRGTMSEQEAAAAPERAGGCDGPLGGGRF